MSSIDLSTVQIHSSECFPSAIDGVSSRFHLLGHTDKNSGNTAGKLATFDDFFIGRAICKAALALNGSSSSDAASIHSDDELQIATDLARAFADGNSVFIGLTDPTPGVAVTGNPQSTDRFSWVDGSTGDFIRTHGVAPWLGAEPNNNGNTGEKCVEMDGSPQDVAIRFRWNDDQCLTKNLILCRSLCSVTTTAAKGDIKSDNPGEFYGLVGAISALSIILLLFVALYFRRNKSSTGGEDNLLDIARDDTVEVTKGSKNGNDAFFNRQSFGTRTMRLSEWIKVAFGVDGANTSDTLNSTKSNLNPKFGQNYPDKTEVDDKDNFDENFTSSQENATPKRPIPGVVEVRELYHDSLATESI